MTDTPAPHDEREALASVLAKCMGMIEGAQYALDLSDALLKAGYGKPRVQPTVEDVAKALAAESNHPADMMPLARAVLALFTNQPTVQEVREQVAREIRALEGGGEG